MITKNQIDASKFGLDDTSWSRSFRMYSLAFNIWPVDNRTTREKLERPLMLDISWTQVELPEFFTTMGDAVHLVPSSARFLRKGKVKGCSLLFLFLFLILNPPPHPPGC